MQELLLQIVSHPFSTLQVFLALWGAVGVLIFFWGFIGFFLSHKHVGHEDHARVQMIWGIILTATATFVWEGIRLLASIL